VLECVHRHNDSSMKILIGSAIAVISISFGGSAFAADYTVNLRLVQGPTTVPITYPAAGPVQLTATVTAQSNQNYLTNSQSQGLCIFAQSSDTTNRCATRTAPAPTNNLYNNVGIKSNTEVIYTGLTVGHVFIGSTGSTGFLNPNPPGTGTLELRRGSATGTILAAINLQITSNDILYNFAPFSLAKDELLVFAASGSNASIRIADLRLSTPVPGPLPILGAAAAFGWTRRLRRRLASDQV